MTTHARLSASSAHRWMNCPGSVRMATGLPDVSNEYARAGTAAHALAETWLTHGSHAAQNLEQVYVDGSPEPVDDEMREGVALFVKTIHDLRQPGDRLFTEKTFDLATICPPEPMFGTADAVLVQKRVLRIFDFKYGQGVVVEVRDNPQLFYYALGAVLSEFARRVFDDKIDIGGDILSAALAQFEKIVITIVQPRAPHADGPVRSVDVSIEELREFARVLLESAHETQAPDAPLRPGEWCRFCPAQAHCPALREHAQLVAQVDFDQVPIDMPINPETISIERAADLLTKVQVLEVWMKALAQRVTRELEAGREVPGWKLVRKRARRLWLGEKTTTEWWQHRGGDVADLYNLVLKSPAQVEKIIGKKNLPESLYARVSSGLTLAPSDDPRPAAAIGPQEDFAALPPATVEADLVVEE